MVFPHNHRIQEHESGSCSTWPRKHLKQATIPQKLGAFYRSLWEAVKCLTCKKEQILGLKSSECCPRRQICQKAELGVCLGRKQGAPQAAFPSDGGAQRPACGVQTSAVPGVTPGSKDQFLFTQRCTVPRSARSPGNFAFPRSPSRGHPGIPKLPDPARPAPASREARCSLAGLASQLCPGSSKQAAALCVVLETIPSLRRDRRLQVEHKAQNSQVGQFLYFFS